MWGCPFTDGNRRITLSWLAVLSSMERCFSFTLIGCTWSANTVLQGVQSVVAARQLLENVKDLQVLCYIQFGEINYDRSCKSKQSWRKKHTRPIFTAHDILNSFFNIHYFQYQYNLVTSTDCNPSFFTHYFI